MLSVVMACFRSRHALPAGDQGIAQPRDAHDTDDPEPDDQHARGAPYPWRAPQRDEALRGHPRRKQVGSVPRPKSAITRAPPAGLPLAAASTSML